MLRYAVVSVVLALLVTSSANATPIAGELNVAGSLAVNATDLNFIPPPGPGGPPCGGSEAGFGCFATLLPETGYFSAIAPFATGQARDLTFGPGGVAPAPAHVMPGVVMLLPNFLGSFVVPGYTTLGFDLRFIQPSVASICTGSEGLNQSCTPTAGSPLTLKNTSTGVEIDFGMFGNFHANGGADFGAGVGIYTAQLAGATIADVFTTVEGGGEIDMSYSANFKASASVPGDPTSVPEPASLITLGLGSVALWVVRRGVGKTRKAHFMEGDERPRN